MCKLNHDLLNYAFSCVSQGLPDVTFAFFYVTYTFVFVTQAYRKNIRPRIRQFSG